MATQVQNAQAFHTWHSNRTYSGHPQLDPWMRDVLLNLQLCLNSFAKQIDENTARLDRLEHVVRRMGR